MAFNCIDLMEMSKNIGMNKAFLHVTSKSLKEANKCCDKKIQSVDKINLQKYSDDGDAAILVVRYRDDIELFIGKNRTMNVLNSNLRKKQLKW